AALDRNRRRILRRAGGDATRFRWHASGGVPHDVGRHVLRVLCDLDASALAFRLERDHAVLHQLGRRARHDRGAAFRLVETGWHPRLGADGADRRARRGWALPAHSCPPPCSGVGPGALYLYADGLDDGPWISGVWRRAAPLDHRRRADRGVVGPLSSPP